MIPVTHSTLWPALTMCILVASNHYYSYVNKELTNSKSICGELQKQADVLSE